MPISSGALEWPVSHHSKPETPDNKEDIDGGNWTPRSPRGKEHEWQPRLTQREEYERWRKRMDRKDPIKTRKRNQGGCCGFLPSNKLNTENEDPMKGEPRDSPREVIKRKRRRRCVLLAFAVSLFCSLLTILFLFLFLKYAGHETIGPEMQLGCTGWCRDHFLISKATTNGSDVYDCCYLPYILDVNVVKAVIENSTSCFYNFSASTCDVAQTDPPQACEKVADTLYDKIGLYNGGWKKPSCKGAISSRVNIVILVGFVMAALILK